jgi:hypothetical protein
MKINLQSREICLRENQPLRLERARGQRICCTAGILWVTLSGEQNDIFLRNGEWLDIADDGLVLIESIGLGRMHL